RPRTSARLAPIKHGESPTFLPRVNAACRATATLVEWHSVDLYMSTFGRARDYAGERRRIATMTSVVVLRHFRCKNQLRCHACEHRLHVRGNKCRITARCRLEADPGEFRGHQRMLMHWQSGKPKSHVVRYKSCRNPEC